LICLILTGGCWNGCKPLRPFLRQVQAQSETAVLPPRIQTIEETLESSQRTG
jgi:hypothetical protein